MSLEHWEAYYRGGALATAPAGPDGLYDLEVRQAWVEFFSTLPQQARILDIGTGNGVICALARETAAARGWQWQIHGSDLARIDPPAHVPGGAERLAGIQFHPGVASERLPFEDASFDAVCGHYALEYSDVALALAQVWRVLKPGGDAQFIMHHADSVLLRGAHASLQEADLVLKQTRLYRRLRRLVGIDQAAPAALQRAGDELRGAIQAVKQALAQAQAGGGGQLLAEALDNVQRLLAARNRLRPQAVGLEVDRTEEALRTSARWVHDTVGRARSAADMALLRQQASDLGFSLVEVLPQQHGQQLVGWQVSMHRP